MAKEKLKRSLRRDDMPNTTDMKILCNAVTEALREVDRCPDDSVRDIFNDKLESWDTGLVMDNNYNIDPK